MRSSERETKVEEVAGNTGWQDNQEAKLFALGNQLRTWRTDMASNTYTDILTYIHILECCSR